MHHLVILVQRVIHHAQPVTMVQSIHVLHAIVLCFIILLL